MGSFCGGVGATAAVEPLDATLLMGDEKPKVESLKVPILVKDPMESFLPPWFEAVVLFALKL